MKMYQIICNMKGSRHIQVEEAHLETIEHYGLFIDLLGSDGMVDDVTLRKLQLNVKSLLDNQFNQALLDLCQKVLFDDNMKAFALHQLILLYIEWEKTKLDALKSEIEVE